MSNARPAASLIARTLLTTCSAGCRNWTDWWSAPAAASEERGYTGHEHLDDVTLIHMNGRAYDPQLARMTSPDPFVPDPLYSQSYNRYAYVYNNPLRYTDPSGFGPCEEGKPFRIPGCGIMDVIRWLNKHGSDCPCEPNYTQPYNWQGDGRDWNLEAAIWHMGFELLASMEAAARAEATLAVPPDTAPSLEKTDQEGLTPVPANVGPSAAACTTFASVSCFFADFSIPQADYEVILGQLDVLTWGGGTSWGALVNGHPVVDQSSPNYQHGKMVMGVVYAGATLGEGLVAQGITRAAPVATATAIRTPYALEAQSASAEAQVALNQVQTGATLYRTGTLGSNMAAESQYWSLQTHS